MRRADLAIRDELGFAPLDSNGSQLLFRFVAAADERRSLGLTSHWPFNQWGRFLPDHATTVSIGHRVIRGWSHVATTADFELATAAAFEMAIDNR